MTAGDLDKLDHRVRSITEARGHNLRVNGPQPAGQRATTCGSTGSEGEGCLDDVGETVGDRVGLFGGLGLDHHPDERLGAGRPQQDAARVAELGLGLASRRPEARRRSAPARRSTSRHVDQHLRQPLHHAGQLGQALAGRRHPRGDVTAPPGCRHRSWRSSLMITCPDCSPPSIEAAGAHLLEHVAVADLGLDRRRCRASRMRVEEARLLITVATTVSSRSAPASCRSARGSRAGGHRRRARRPRRPPGSGRRRRRSAKPGVGAVLDAPPRAASPDAVEPQPSLMFQAVGRVVDGDDLGAERAEGVRRGQRGGALGAVEHDLAARSRRVCTRRRQVVDVARLGVGLVDDSADAGTGRSVRPAVVIASSIWPPRRRRRA